jgi:hypothetical protein
MQGYGELLHRRLPLQLRLGGSRESYVRRIERGNSDVCAALDIGFAIKKGEGKSDETQTFRLWEVIR